MSDNSVVFSECGNLYVLCDHFRHVCASFCVNYELFIDLGFEQLHRATVNHINSFLD